MPTLRKMAKKKSKKELIVKKPETVLHESFTTEPDNSDDFFFTARRVRFSASVSQQPIMCIDDYSDSERKSTWYDRQDKAVMNKKHDKMLRRYEAGKRCKEGMTYRGLDAWTDKGHSKFEATMDRMLSAVMDEQDDQWRKYYNDPDRIAMVARSVSKRNVAQAIKIAKEDEFEAKEAYKGDFNEEAGSDEEDSGNNSGHKRLQGRRRSSTAKAIRRERRASKERPGKKDGSKKRTSKRRSSSSKKKSEQ